jgi:hypothetical protein
MPELSWKGKHKLKSLRKHGGKSALATVVEYDKRWGIPESGYGGIPLGRDQHYTLKIKVQPAGEPEFEAEIKEHDYFLGDFDAPQPGDQFAIVYDPDDHSSVVRDPLDADSVVPRKPTELKLQPDEEERFRATVFANLDKARADGQLNEEQYQAKKAQLEAEFGGS